MSPDPKPDASVTRPAQAHSSADPPDAATLSATSQWPRTHCRDDRRAGAAPKMRFIFLGLSVGGICGAALLSFHGHTALATQLLAGDVLLIFLLLLAM